MATRLMMCDSRKHITSITGYYVSYIMIHMGNKHALINHGNGLSTVKHSKVSLLAAVEWSVVESLINITLRPRYCS